MKRLAIFFILISCISTVNAQQLAWVFGIGSTDEKADDEVIASVVDTMNNVYITGTFDDIANFNPLGGAYFLDAYGNATSNHDLFLAKYTSQKEIFWAFKLSAVGKVNPRCLAVDNNQNIYVSGYVTGNSSGDSLDFDPGVGVANHSLGSSGFSFIAKYDVNGNFVWAIDSIGAIRMVTDNSGNLFFSDGTNIGKRDSNGNLLWSYPYASGLAKIEVEDDGDLLVTDRSYNSIDLNPGVGTHMVTTTNGFTFVSRFDSDGNFEDASIIEWNSFASNIVSAGLESGSDGVVYLAGTFYDGADFDPSGGVFTMNVVGQQKNIFMLKMDSIGTLHWAQQITGLSNCNNIGIDENEDLYVNGSTSYNYVSDFDPSGMTYNLQQDAVQFTAKYNSNGAFVWAAGIGDYVSGSGVFAPKVNSFSVSRLGESFIGGQFKNRTAYTYDFNPDSVEVSNIFCYGTSNQSDGDGFLYKLTTYPVSVNELNEQTIKMDVYPNPVNNRLVVNFGKHYELVKVNLISVTGQSMMSSSYQNVRSTILNMVNLSSGIYFLRVTVKDVVTVIKVVKD